MGCHWWSSRLSNWSFRWLFKSDQMRLTDNQLKSISGGSLTATFLNAIVKGFNLIIELGKSLGSRIFMTKVVVRNGNVDGALRNLKAANSKDGSLAQLREKQDGYLKPGVRRRNAKKEGIKNARRRFRRENRDY